jgi:hypothetical protein
VAILTGAVTEVNKNGIQLNITKQQVQGLPPWTSIIWASSGAARRR